MAGLDSKHISFGDLRYYDSQIKKYVDDIFVSLSQTTVTPEQLDKIENKLIDLSSLVNAHSLQIAEFVKDISNNEATIKNLEEELTSTDKELSSKIEFILATIEGIKESYATQADLQKELSVVKQEIQKHIKDISVAIESCATEDYVDNKINSIKIPTKLSELNNDVGFLKEHQDLTDYAKKSEIPDVSRFITSIPTEYVTETELDKRGFITQHQSLDGYATETFVEKKIAEAELCDKDVDLSIYYTKSESDLKFADKESFDTTIPTLQNDVAQLFDKSEQDHEKIEQLQKDFATTVDRDYLDNAIANIPQPDLTNYYTKDEVQTILPDVSDYLTKEYLDNTLENYATETYVKNAIAEAELNDKEVDLSGYATQDDLKQLEAKIPSVEGLATEEFVDEKIDNLVIPDVSGFATKEELEEAVNNIEHPSVDLTGYATEEFVNTSIANIPKTDLSNYYNKEETDTAIKTAVDGIEIPEVDLTSYATQQFVLDKIAEVPTDYLKEVPSEYVTESELSEELAKIEHPTVDLTGYATEQWVNEQGFIKEVPDEYVTETELDAKGYLTEHQDISHLATKDEVPSIEGLASTDYVDQAIANIPETDVSNLATKSELEAVEAKVDAIVIPEVPTKVSELENDLGYLTEHQSLEGYVKEAQLKDAIDAVDHKIVTKTSELENDLGFLTEGTLPDFVTPQEITDFVTLTEIEEAGFLKVIPEEYVTEAELDEKGYLTEHQSLDDYAKKSELPDVSNFATKDQIPSVEGLATETYVNQKVAEVVIPDVSNFVTENTVNTLLETKADNVPFTTNLIVKNPVGGFVSDESVQNMTIAQILTKLLGLELYAEPEDPEEPQSIAEKIIANEISMYSIDSNGELAETSFNLIDGTEEPTESGFYTIRDSEGNIIEAGYQDLTIKNDEMYYIIALLNELNYNTNVKLQSWDPDEAVWVDSELDLTSDSTVVDTMCNEAGVDITHIDKTKYTVWVVTGNSDPLCTGSILRYIIVEE